MGIHSIAGFRRNRTKVTIPQSKIRRFLTAPFTQGSLGRSHASGQIKLTQRRCNMGKSKNYDIYISPGKWYLYKTRRVLFALSVVLFVLNMIIIAGFDESMRKTAIISIVLSTIFGVVQFVDSRKVHWNWFYIIVLCAIFLLLSSFFVFSTALIFMRYIWLGELVFFFVLVPLLLRKKTG